MPGRNGLKLLIPPDPGSLSARALAACALVLLALPLFAQQSQIKLFSFGSEVKTRHPLVVEDGEVWIALGDIGAALPGCNPVGGISGGKAILKDPHGRQIFQPIQAVDQESYVPLASVCEAAGLSDVFDAGANACRIRRNLSRIDVANGKIAITLPGPPAGCVLKTLDNPPRAYFDIPAANLDTASRSYRVASGGIKSLRLGQNTPDTVRVVLDLDSPGVGAKLSIKRSEDGLDLICPGAAASAQVPLNEASKTGNRPEGLSPAATSPSAKGPKKPSVELSKVNFRADESGNREIRILASRATEPRARFLTDPPRLSLDFDDTICGVDYPELLVDDSVVRGIRSGQFLLDPAIARVVLDLKKSVYYQMWYDDETGEIVIALEPPPATGGKLSEKTIVVDPGHGDKIVGARRACGGTILKEEEINLAIGLELQKLLEEEGTDVVMTRTDGSNLGDTQAEDLAGRVKVAEDADADLFVSIHCNATRSGSEAKKSGTETYHYSARSFWLADAVQTKLVSGLGTHNGGTRVARFHVLRNTSMPAILVEVAYLSNPEDQKNLADPEFRKKAAKAIFDGLKGYVEGSAWDASEPLEAIEGAVPSDPSSDPSTNETSEED